MSRITTSAPSYTPPLSDWQRDRRDPVLQPVTARPEHPFLSLALWIAIAAVVAGLWRIFA